jgi:hypothetical protein
VPVQVRPSAPTPMACRRISKVQGAQIRCLHSRTKSRRAFEMTETEPQQMKEAPSADAVMKTSTLRFRAQRYLHRRWPTIVKDPNYDADLAAWRRRDYERNAHTCPPAEESVNLCCMWAIEFYTPLHIQSLINGMSKLGWDKTTSRSSNPIPWIRDLRKSSRMSGQMNLGRIVRPETPDRFGTSLKGPLPEGVEYASGQIFSLTSSIACMLICFTLDKSLANSFDGILRKKFETWLEPIGSGGQAIHQPDSQKENAIRDIRRSIAGSIAVWFQHNFPGVFSSIADLSDFPTCELTTLRYAKPFPKEGESVDGTFGYLRTLGFHPNLHAWELTDIPAIRFSVPDLLSKDFTFHSCITLNEAGLSDQQLKEWGGRSPSSYVAFIGNRLDKLLAHWGLTVLLAAYERRLGALRDSLELRTKSSRSSVRVLRALSDFAAQGIDISAITTELNHYVDQKRWAFNELGVFRSLGHARNASHDVALSEALRSEIKARAEWVLNTDHSMRAVFSQYAEVLGARENIKAQQTIGRLTWVLVFLTVIIAVLTFIIAYAALKSEAGVPFFKILKNFL